MWERRIGRPGRRDDGAVAIRTTLVAAILAALVLPFGSLAGSPTSSAAVAPAVFGLAPAATGDGIAVEVTGPASLTVGQSAQYTVTMTNLDVDATTVFAQVGATPQRASTSLVSADGWVCNPGFGGLFCSRPSLLSGATSTIVVTVEPFDGPSLEVFGYVDDETGITGQAGLEVEVTGAVDLGLTATRPTVMPGAPYEASFVVSEVGTDANDVAGPISVSVAPSFYDPSVGSFTDGGVTVSGGPGWSCAGFVCTHPGPVPSAGSLPAVVAAGVFGLEGSIRGEIGNDDDVFGNNVAAVGIYQSGPDPAVSVSGSTLDSGQPGSFTVTASNSGDEPTSGPISVGVTTELVSATGGGDGWTCTTTTVVTCTSTTVIAAHAVAPPITVSGIVPVGPTSVSASATVSPGGVRSTNDSASTSVAVTLPPYDLAVDLVASDTGLTPAAPFELEATVTNVGVGEAAGPITLDVWAPYVSGTASGDGWTCLEHFGRWECTHPGPVPATTSLPTVTVVGAVDGYVFDGVMTAEVGPGGAPGNDLAQIDVPILLADLATSVTADPAAVDEGDDATYTATITNVGPGVGHHSVIADIAPSFSLSAVTVDGGADWTCADEFGWWSCTATGPLGVGATLSPIVVSGATDGWEETARVDVSARLVDAEGFDVDQVAFDNDAGFAAVTVNPLVDLAVGGAAVGELVVGATGSLEVTAEQLGIGTIAGGEISVTMSGLFTDASASGTDWICTENFAGADCIYIAEAGPGESLPAISYTGVVGPTVDGIGEANLSVSHPEDRRWQNDGSRLEVPVVAPVDLVVSMADDGPFTAGEPSAYTVVVDNVGSSPSSGSVQVWLSTDFGVDVVGAEGVGWTCSLSFCERSDPLAGGAPFAPITFTVVPTWSHDGTVTSTVSVDGGGDGRTDNNTDEVTTPFPPTLDAAVGMQPNTPVFLVGNPNGYTVTVTNVGTDEVPGPFTVELALDADLTGATTTGTGWTCVPVSDTWIECDHPGPLPVAGALPDLVVTADLSPSSAGVLSSAWLTADADQRGDNDSTSVLTQVAGESDLTVEATDAAATFGEQFTILATVTNVLATDAIGPVELTFSGGSATSRSASGTDWTCELADGDDVVCTHPGPVPASGTLPVVTFAADAGVTFDGFDGLAVTVQGATDANDTNDDVIAIVTVDSPVDLRIDVDDADATVAAGQSGELTVTVTNVGTAAADGSVVVTGVSYGADAVAGSGTGWTCSDVGIELDCEHGGPLAAGASLPPLTVTFDAPPFDTSVISSYEVVHPADGRSGNDVDGESTPVESRVDLTVGVDDGVAFFTAGQSGEYTVLVENVGTETSDGEISVGLAAIGPAELTAVTGDGWTCDVATTTATCATGSTVSPGEALPALVATVQTTTDGGTQVALAADVSGGGDQGPANNSDLHTTLLASPDLTVDVDDADVTFTAPGTGSYTVTVGNDGVVDTVGDVAVAFAASGPVEITSATGDGWTCTPAPVSCSRTDALAPLGTFPQLTVAVDVIVTDVREATFTATATGFDASPDNSTDSETTPIVVPADLAVALDVTPPWYVGREATFDVNVTNVGTAPTVGPATVTIDRAGSATGDGWSCVVDGAGLSCSNPDPVPAGGDLPALTVSLTPQLTDEPALAVTARVSDPSDGTSTNDSVMSVVDVLVAVDLDVELTPTPETFTVLQPGTVTALVRNLGVEDAPGPVTVVMQQSATSVPNVTGTGWDCLHLLGTTSCTHPGPVPAGGTLPPIDDVFSDVLLAGYPTTTFTATVTGVDDVRPTNDSTVLRVPTLGVDLELDVVDTNEGVDAEIGDTRTFELVVANVGGVAPPGAATVQVVPGFGLIRGAFAGTGWSCVPDGQEFTCSTTEPVPANGPYPTLRFDVFVAGDAFPGSDVDATVTAPGESLFDFRNRDAAWFVVNGAPDLRVDLTVPSAVDVGSVLDVAAEIGNFGQVDATGTTTVDIDLPPGTTSGTATGDGWTCEVVVDEGVIRCTTDASVAPGGSLPPVNAQLPIELTAYPSFRLGSIVDNPGDGDITNNATLTSPIRVEGIPDLHLSIDRTSVLAGRTNSLALTVANIGTEPAGGVTTLSPDPAASDPGIVPVAVGGTGWTCTPVIEGEFTCAHPGPVPAGGALPDLVIDVAVDDERFDEGRACEPVEAGGRLLRGCTTIDWVGRRPVMLDASNPANPLGAFGRQFGVDVVQPVDLTPMTTVAELHPGARATLTTVVRNAGVEPTTGPIYLIQRVGCGVRADLAVGEQGQCLPGTDTIDVSVVAVTADGWTCGTDDGVVTCSHPGPLAPGENLPEVVVQADIGIDLYGSNLWIAPTVANGSDTNSRNDQPEDGRLIDLRPDPDLAIGAFTTEDVTVGVNDVVSASIWNVSSEPLVGPTNVTVELGAPLEFIQVQEAGWTCDATIPTTLDCEYAGTIEANTRLGLTLVVTPIDTGSTQQTVTWTLANAADSRADNDTTAGLVRIFQLPAPTAVLGVDRTVLRVNQTGTFDASFSENTFATTQYRWDFGDGVTDFGEVVTHDYQAPGIYTAVLTVSNGLRTSRATQRVIVVPDEPLVAEAGDDRVAEEQLPIAFDGGASLPFFAIESFVWDFGDGGSAVGRNVQHIYTEPGTYTATLTVRSGTEEATDTLVVEVLEQGAGVTGGLAVTVVDSDGDPVRAADVAVLDVDGVRYAARSDDDGVANLVGLPDGRFSVYAYKLGYLPSVGRARVSGGLGVAQVALRPGTVGEATLESRRLTLDEVIAAGIDVNDPANQNIIEFDINLSFAVTPPYPEVEQMLAGLLVNDAGVFYDLPLDWTCNTERTKCSSPDGVVTIEGEETEEGPVVTVLIIPVTASFLKEFYEVTLLVANLAPKGFAFVDGAAVLDLPAGLSLAPTSEPQDLLIELDPIASGKTGVASWIVRGDVAGEYDLGAAYTGVLAPIGSPILLQARTEEPIKVWGTDALNIRVRAQRQVRDGKPYLVRLGFENVSDGPIYNLGAELGDLAGDGDFDYAPWTDRIVRVDAIEPLETVWTDIWLIPDFNGELIACNLCARGSFGRIVPLPAAIEDGIFDSGDLADAFTGMAAGASSAVEPGAIELESRPDEGLVFTAVTDGSDHRLEWTAVDGATGYEIHTLGGGDPVATVGPGATSTTVAGGATAYVVATLFDDERQLRHPIATPAAAPQPPPIVAPDDTVAIAGESTVIDVLGNDADPTGGPLSITGVVQPDHGTVQCTADGTCTYTPDDGFVGTDTFEVIVAGSNGVEVTHVVTVTVAPTGTNRNPVAVADSLTVEAGVEHQVLVLANDSDPDADGLTLTAVGQPLHGVVTCDPDGTCRYTADVTYTGFDSFTYEISDADGATASATVAVTVTPTTTTTVPTTPTSSTPTSSTPTSSTPTSTTPTSSTPTSSSTVPSGSGATSSTTTPTSPGAAALPPVPAAVPAFYQPLVGFPDRVVPGQIISFTMRDGTTSFRLVVYSDPTVLATGNTGGTYQATIPSSLAPGTHHLVLWAVVDGIVEVRGAAVRVLPQSDPVGELPATGSSPRLGLWVATVLTLLGLVAVWGTARRRPEPDERRRP